MKERPILFSAPMVRAILDGTKTQTRRVVKPQPTHFNPVGVPRLAKPVGPNAIIACRYGQPGDRLWVRESHWYFKDERDPVTGYYPPKMNVEDVEFRADSESKRHGWYPSIHMPRWASRITLEISGVRVERLNDISEEDANAEGCERLHEDEHGYVFREDRDWKLCPKCGGTRLHDALGGGGGVIHDVDCRECDTYQKRFKHLWQSINGPDSWAANPWVWVVGFKAVKGNSS